MGDITLDPSLRPDEAFDQRIDRASSGTESFQLQHLEDAQVNEVLKRKRKAREHKACYPCRQRKVKCDLTRPCQTCRDRDHPELCTYTPPEKRQALHGPADDASIGSAVVLGRHEFDLLMQKLDGLEAQISELRTEAVSAPRSSEIPAMLHLNTDRPATTLQHHRAMHGMHTTNYEGVVEHFGVGSVPTLVQALQEPDNDAAQSRLREQLSQSIVPLFGLDEETTYPFIDLWSLPHGSTTRLQELARVIPEDHQARHLWQRYRDVAWVIFPGVADLVGFGNNLTAFLSNRTAQVDASDAVTSRSIFGKSYSWLGLLFAVLASGAQVSDLPRKQRILTSQVYICCAMECMKTINFLSRPNNEIMQTLLVVQSVLIDNMSAGTAWHLLGLTIRLGQGLGLHQPCRPGTSKALSHERSRIWWAVVLQDSLLSIVYDRAGHQFLATPRSMPMPDRFGPLSAFHAAMYELAEISLSIVNDRHRPPQYDSKEYKKKHYSRSREIRCQLEIYESLTKDHNSMEYWYLKLHCSFTLAELCRPGLLLKVDMLNRKIVCIAYLIETINAYLALRQANAYACTSWAAIHRALSSALLLGILGTSSHPKAVPAIAGFLKAMQDIITQVDPEEFAGPIKRGIMALYELNIPDLTFPAALLGSVSGSEYATADATSGLQPTKTIVNMNIGRSTSIRSKGKSDSGSTGGKLAGHFKLSSLRGLQQPELSKRLYKLIKSQNQVIGAYETAGKDSQAIASQLSEWGESTEDEALSDVSDKLAVLLSEIAEQEESFSQHLEDSRGVLKQIRDVEKSVQPSRDHKQKITDEIEKLKFKEPESTKIVTLEQELVRAEAQSLVAEAQLTNVTRQKFKEAFDVHTAAIIERAEKQIILAKHARHVLSLLDDTPIVPGEERTTFAESSEAREALNQAEEELRSWTPNFAPLESNAGKIGTNAMPTAAAADTTTAAPHSEHLSTQQQTEAIQQAQATAKTETAAPVVA